MAVAATLLAAAAALPAAEPVGPLKESDIFNASFRIRTPDGVRQIRVRNGEYRKRGTVVFNLLRETVTRGDFDGDGAEDAAVLYVHKPGGDVIIVGLAALRNVRGRPKGADTLALGDRISVSSIRFKSPEILIDAVIQGENDPPCCPSRPVLMTIAVDNPDRLRLSVTRR